MYSSETLKEILEEAKGMRNMMDKITDLHNEKEKEKEKEKRKIYWTNRIRSNL